MHWSYCSLALSHWYDSSEFEFANDIGLPSKFNDKLHQVTKMFYTCHDSITGVPCAKFCSEHFTSIWIRTKQYFHQIWIVMENCKEIGYRKFKLRTQSLSLVCDSFAMLFPYSWLYGIPVRPCLSRCYQIPCSIFMSITVVVLVAGVSGADCGPVMEFLSHSIIFIVWENY